MAQSFDSLTAAQIAAGVAAGDFTATEVAQASLAAIEAREGGVQAFLQVSPELALEASHRVGLPLLRSASDLTEALAAPDFARLLDPTVLRMALTLALVASVETLLSVEASDRLGGCVAAADLDGRSIDVAADRFATSGARVRALVDELEKPAHGRRRFRSKNADGLPRVHRGGEEAAAQA